ncbi:MAG: hypothetical protein LAN84_09945 [Acidobacteriia bacterium]|nr:hypothetical protein [Terriglobia bacterium]
MRLRTIVLLGIILAASAWGLAGGQGRAQSLAPSPAAAETHEGVTITAQPWTAPADYKPRFPKKTPLTAGLVGIQVAVQNDSAAAVRVNLERIRLVITLDEESRQNLAPLSAEDVADLILKGGSSDPTAKRQRIPLPIGKPKTGRSKEWTQLEDAARAAGVPASVIPPHGKVQGLLYFDLAGQYDLLRTARLYIPEVTDIEKGRSLLYFELELSKAAAR